MKKQRELTSKVASWYPTATEIVDIQREQVLKSRQEAAAFAAQKFGKPEIPWWRRLFAKTR